MNTNMSNNICNDWKDLLNIFTAKNDYIVQLDQLEAGNAIQKQHVTWDARFPL